MLSTILHGLWSRKRRLLGTCIAVVLGVAFLAGTMILGDTTKAGFTDTFTAANDGTDVVVRNATRIGSEEERTRGLIDESMVADVAAIDGVAAAVPEVSGVAQLIGADGKPVGGNGPPTIATNWIDDPELGWLTLVDGRAPAADAEGQPVEVVIDRATANDEDLSVGDTTTVLTPERIPVTIVGMATYGDTERVGGVTYVAFDTDTAQQILAGSDTQISSVLVRGTDGVSATELEGSIASSLPGGVEAITGADLTAEQEKDIERDFLGFFKMILLAFAGIAIVVAAFSIHNTFSILVAQRTRESALMRAIGASRRQVIVGVAVEAVMIGVLATGIGFAAGIGIAALLQDVMESGMDMPNADLVIGSGAVIASAIVGIGTTLIASVGPAIKASRVAPLAALRDVSIDRSGSSKVRAGIGLLLTGAGIAALVTATSTPDAAMSRAALGALGLLIGAVVMGPVIARPAAAVLGALPAATRGIAGRLARRNAMRNPRRTAASASALLVGTAVVGLFTTFGASIKASIDDTIDDNFAGDFVILPEGFSGSLLSPGLASAIAELPGVNAAVGTAFGPATVDGNTVEEIRDLVRGIHPVILEDRGLDAALSAVVARSPVPVTLDVNISKRPPATVESAAYFVITEALTNVAKHAHATRAYVSVARAGDRLVVEIRDNGQWCWVKYTIRVPSNLDVVVNNDDSRVTVGNIDGNVEVDADNGRVVLAGVSGTVVVNSDNGRVEGSGLSGSTADVSSDNGRVELAFTEVPDRVEARSDNGSIDIALPDVDEGYNIDSSTDNGSEDVVGIADNPTSPHTVIATSDNGSVTIALRADAPG